MMTPTKEAFENPEAKGENTGKPYFLLLARYFLPFKKQIYIFETHLFCGQLMLSLWTCPTLLSLGKGIHH